MTDEHYNHILERKKSALEVLAPLGFVDNEDGECPGAIYHTDIRGCIDINGISPADVVKIIFQRGKEEGIELVQSNVRKTLGI